MEMDQNNNMALPLEERSRSSENRDVFDFKNLRNCLPTTNHESGRCSVEAQSIRRSVWRLMKIKALMNMRKNISGLSQKLTWLDKNSTPQRPACLDEASTSQETEKNLERPHEEALKRMTFKCELPRKQENIISPVLISNRKIIQLQKYCEQTKEKCHRNILLVREKDRLRRTCFSRGLSLENMNEPVGDSSQQMKNNLCVALVNDIVEEKRKLQKEVEEAARLLHYTMYLTGNIFLLSKWGRILKEKERQLTFL